MSQRGYLRPLKSSAMRIFLSKVAVLAVPLSVAVSLIGLSQAVDPLITEGWKALAVFSVLGCLSTVASGSRRTQAKAGAMRRADLPGIGREAA